MFTVLRMNWDKQCIDGCCYCTLNDVQRNLRIEDIIKKRSKRFTTYMYDHSLPVELYCACIRPYWDAGDCGETVTCTGEYIPHFLSAKFQMKSILKRVLQLHVMTVLHKPSVWPKFSGWISWLVNNQLTTCVTARQAPSWLTHIVFLDFRKCSHQFGLSCAT